MSEDPYVTGKLAASYINGAQSTGVISTIKHWVANDQEHERIGVNVMVNERALREIHMLPFQIAISDSKPGAVMACYNKINGKHVSESEDLLNGVLRREWGWDGLIMSDWYVRYECPAVFEANRGLQVRYLLDHRSHQRRSRSRNARPNKTPRPPCRPRGVKSEDYGENN